MQYGLDKRIENSIGITIENSKTTNGIDCKLNNR